MTMLQTKPFRLLTARDLMTRDLLLIPKEASLRHAAHMLAQSQVSGAPVVDDTGRCIGVLSTTDFMRWMDDEQRRPTHPADTDCFSEWEMVVPESLPCDVVAAFMTRDPVTVSPDLRIAELARIMLDAHIHRVIVVDPERHPVGVVTTTDVLAAVARAVDTH
jgi:CBS domain-containing protein